MRAVELHVLRSVPSLRWLSPPYAQGLAPGERPVVPYVARAAAAAAAAAAAEVRVVRVRVRVRARLDLG